MNEDHTPGPAERAWKGWKTADGCGYGIFCTGPDDPFISACHLHDYEYMQHHTGEISDTREQVDERFLRRMLLIAHNQGSSYLVARAYAFYYCVRAVGQPIWDRQLTEDELAELFDNEPTRAVTAQPMAMLWSDALDQRPVLVQV